MKTKRVDRLLVWTRLAGIAFGLNLVWEFAQVPLYAGRPPWPVCAAAAVNDAVIILVAIAVLLRLRRRPDAAFWMGLAGVLAVVAFGIELRAMLTDRWSYSAAMPMVGPVGLSPLLQLPVLGVVTAALCRPWAPRDRAGVQGPTLSSSRPIEEPPQR